MGRGEESRVPGKRGLAVKYIDAGSADFSFREEPCQSIIVDDTAAGCIDEDCIFLQKGELFFTQEMAGFLIEGEVDGDDVAGPEEGIQVGIGNDRGLSAPAEADDMGAENLCDFGNPAADSAGADDAQCFSSDFLTAETGRCSAVSDCFISFGNLPEQGQNQTENKLCHGLGGVAGAVGNRDVPFPAGIQVHMVDAGEGNADVFQRGGTVQCFLFQRIIGNDQKVCIPDALAQFLLVLRNGIKNSKGKALFFQRLGKLAEKSGRNAERLCDDDMFHGKTPFMNLLFFPRIENDPAGNLRKKDTDNHGGNADILTGREGIAHEEDTGQASEDHFHTEQHGCLGGRNVFLPYGLQRIGDTGGKNPCIKKRPEGAFQSGQGGRFKKKSQDQVQHTGREKLACRKKDRRESLCEVIHDQNLHREADSTDQGKRISGADGEISGDGDEINAYNSKKSTDDMEKTESFPEKNTEKRHHQNIGGSEKTGF